MQYIEEKFGITQKEQLAIDALQQVQRCVGNVIRSKYDYGLIILADKRYMSKKYYLQLPKWMRDAIPQGNKDLPTDVIVQ